MHDQLHQLNQVLPQGRFELVTDTVAIAAAASPWWLPALKETSEVFGLLLPIVGVIWLLIQIGFKLHQHFRQKPTS